MSYKILVQLDKASVLGDAIKYLKQLQEQVKSLEEQLKKKPDHETVVSINSSKLSNSCDDSSSCDDYSSTGGCFNRALPKIEVRVSDKNVLIHINCEKQRGLIPKILSEIEKFHLTVTNTSALQFGDCTMDITVISQVILINVYMYLAL